MKKKLLLLPIALMSSFLSACEYEVAHVSLEEILDFGTESIENSMVWINKKSDRDYNGKLWEIIKNYSSKVTKQDKYTNEGDIYLSYNFNPKTQLHKDFNYFSVDLFKDGRINTYCSGSGFTRTPKNQLTTYTLEKEDMDKLMGDIDARLEEIKQIKIDEEAKAKEKAGIYKFLNALENPNKDYSPSMIYYEKEVYVERGMRKTRTVQDGVKLTTELVDDLRNLEYKEIDKEISFSDRTVLKCEVSNDWYLLFHEYQPYAQIHYSYDNTLIQTSLNISYQINDTKLSELLKKIEKIIIDQAAL